MKTISRIYPLLITASILLFSLAACTSQQSISPTTSALEAELADTITTGSTLKPTATATKTSPPTPTAVPATSTPKPTEIPPTETAAPAGPPPLDYIAMIDELNGWGLNKRFHLLKTVDGGNTWEKVVRKKKDSPESSPRVFFLDANNAWVVNSAAEGAIETIFRTNDAGLTWQSTTVPFRIGNIIFIDPQNGWGLFTEDCGAGSCAGILSHTTDGGASWEVIHIISAGSDDDPKKIPLAGQKFGPSFRNSNQGWVGGTQSKDGYVYLFMTQDGGVTWQHQDLILPAGADNKQLEAHPPRFFTPQDGILSLYYKERVFYTTNDGGTTWTAGIGIPKGRLYECASAQDCWVWEQKRETMAITHDGGQTWEEVLPNINLGDILQMDFVNATTGWALVKEQRTPTKLLKTTDGGLNWELVPYSCCK